jgi:hypothetical protein
MLQEKTNAMNQLLPPNPPKKLLDRYRDALRLKQYSARTEKTYVLWVKSYILFHLTTGKYTPYPFTMTAAVRV